MTCSIYKVDLSVGRRYHVANLNKHTDISQWLIKNGDQDYAYEIWKTRNVHSRWHWKSQKGKWGRMATPRKKPKAGTK